MINLNSQKVQRIAIMRLSALGDVVLMAAVVRAIQRAYPLWKITWIIGQAAHALLSDLDGVEFIVIKKPDSFKDYWHLRQQFKRRRFDVLLAAQASLRTNLIYPFIKAPIKIGFDERRARDGHGFFVNQTITFREEHLLDGFMQFAQQLGVTDLSASWHLPVNESHFDWVKQQLNQSGRWLAINAASSKLERNWLVDRYVAVIEEATKRWNVNIVLTGGPDMMEQEMAQAIVEKTTVPCLDLVGKTDMKSLAALFGSVDVLLAPDTGPVHIATAMGTPVVGLYAVATAKLTGPYCSQALSVDRYPEAVRAFLKKDPKTTSWRTRVHHKEAMALITVDDVLEKLNVVLGEA